MDLDKNTRFSFRAVEVFITIVEEGSVTAAARRLGASPSAVSLQLSNLESTMGTRLIERSSQRFALTDAGELFHPRAIRILDEITSAKAVLSKSMHSPKIVLKIAMIEDFDPVVMPNWLSAVSDEYPNIKFKIKSGPSHENHVALGDRSADMIIAVDSVDAAEWIEEYPVLSDPYVLIKSCNLPDAISIDDLMKHSFVRYSREQLMGRQIEAHLRRNKITCPKEHEFSSNQAVFSMVDALQGWSITTLTALSSLANDGDGLSKNNRLSVCPLPFPAFNRRISVCARRDALGELPSSFAGHLRTALQEALISPLKTSFSGLKTLEELVILD